MKRKVFQIAVAAAIMLGLGILVMGWLRSPSDLAQLIQTRTAESRYSRWAGTALYQRFARLTKSHLIWRAASRQNLEAARLEKKLLQSGDLVKVTFYLFGRHHFDPELQQYKAMHFYFNDEYRIWHCYLGNNDADRTSPTYARVGNPMFNHGWTVICPPQDVAFWQQEFCVMTNRILWMELRKAEEAEDGAGFSQYTQCLLPDRSIINIFQCQKWLNDNIAAGWRVGLMSSNLPNGDLIYVPLRAK